MIISNIVSGTYTASINELVRVDAHEQVTIHFPPSESGAKIGIKFVNGEEAVTVWPAAGEMIDGRPRFRYGSPDLWVEFTGVSALDDRPAGWLVTGFYQQLYP